MGDGAEGDGVAARLLAAAGVRFALDPASLDLRALEAPADGAAAPPFLPPAAELLAPGGAAAIVHAEDRGRVLEARRAAAAGGGAARSVTWRSARCGRTVREVLARDGGGLAGVWLCEGLAAEGGGQDAWVERVLDAVPDPVFVKDTAHRWVLVNRAFAELVGHPREALLGRSDPDFFPRDQVEVFWRQDEAVLRGEGVDLNEEWITTREGRTLRVATKKSAFAGPRGERALVGVIRDITARVTAEVALRESEARFRTIFDQGPLGMALLDAGLRLRQVNPTLCRMLGRAPADLAGRALAELTHPDDRREADTAEHLLSGALAVQKSERRYLRPDGRVVWAALTLSLIGEADGDAPCFVAMLEDAGERKAAEAALREARDAALESARAKSRFLAVMSHEIRTPLNAVVGMTGVLVDTGLSAEQRECVETIRASGDALLEVIDDILDFSKLESDRLELERAPFSLRALVEGALDLVAPRAAEKGLALSLLVDDPAPAELVGDPARLKQVLVNLLSNAVKFTERGEVRVHVEAAPLAPPRWALTFVVEDTGLGIPAERLGRLFQAFTQVDASTTRRYGGTGLGLAICKRLVELMGGTIGVESAPGRGSTFRARVRLEAVPGAADELAAGRAALAGRRLLVVEAPAGPRRALEALARAWGLEVRATGEPAEAAAWLAAGEAFDLGLLGEPRGADAEALARALRPGGGGPPLPLVLAADLGRAGVHRAGGPFQAVVTRPVKAAPLQAALLAALGRPPAARDGAAPALDRGLGARHPLRLLLVDDNAVNLRVAARVLERMGYQADAATTGVEALEAVRRRRYDVVLMDVQMPVMDGVEATRRMRAELPAAEQPRIVAMTADVLAGDRERCLAAGMDDFVGKPVRVEELAAALLRAPARGAEPRAPEAAPARAGGAEAAPGRPAAPDDEAARALDDATLRALRAAAGDSAIHDLLGLFLADVPTMLDGLAAAVTRGDVAEAQRLAHGLRGSCGTLGARLMTGPCAALEEAARGRDLGAAGQHLAGLRAAFERTRVDAAARLAARGR